MLLGAGADPNLTGMVPRRVSGGGEGSAGGWYGSTLGQNKGLLGSQPVVRACNVLFCREPDDHSAVDCDQRGSRGHRVSTGHVQRQPGHVGLPHPGDRRPEDQSLPGGTQTR